MSVPRISALYAHLAAYHHPKLTKFPVPHLRNLPLAPTQPPNPLLRLNPGRSLPLNHLQPTSHAHRNRNPPHNPPAFSPRLPLHLRSNSKHRLPSQSPLSGSRILHNNRLPTTPTRQNLRLPRHRMRTLLPILYKPLLPPSHSPLHTCKSFKEGLAQRMGAQQGSMAMSRLPFLRAQD
jgi:hypothetical protein